MKGREVRRLIWPGLRNIRLREGRWEPPVIRGVFGSATMKTILTAIAGIMLVGAAVTPADAYYYYHGHRYPYRYHGHYYNYHYRGHYYNRRTCHVSGAGNSVCHYY
jgi:hypothetical protein